MESDKQAAASSSEQVAQLSSQHEEEKRKLESDLAEKSQQIEAGSNELKNSIAKIKDLTKQLKTGKT